MRIRDADPDRDAAACAAIYAPSVKGSAISFEDEAPDPAEIARRIRSYLASHAWLVAERDRTVLGYAYGSPHRERAAYRWAADVAVYVAADARGAGVGTALYQALFARLRERGYRQAVSGVTLPNEASLALHRKLGFVDVGTYRAIGWKDGAWRDVTWMQLDLAPGSDAPPAEAG